MLSACWFLLANNSPVANELAIVIDDLGYSYQAGKRAIDLPGQITLAILPFAPNTRALAKYAKEKNIALQIALKLSVLIKIKHPEVHVILTREKDVFIPLHLRRKIAKRNKSDLFISLHVDSVGKKSTRGTSIYTLSDKASDKVTAQLAERENKADLIAGINLDKVDNEVASILLDLKRRDTKNSSAIVSLIFSSSRI